MREWRAAVVLASVVLGLAMLGLATGVPARASVALDPALTDRAVFVMPSCGGGTLSPAVRGAPVRAALDANLDHTFVLEPVVSGGVRLRGFSSRLYVVAAGAGLRRQLGVSARADEAAIWHPTPLADGQFGLLLSDGLHLGVAEGANRAALSAGTIDCAGSFTVDQFPVFAPWDETLFVDARAAAGGDGTLAAPFRTIQEAIDRAEPGSRIRVSAGVYRGNVMFGRRQSGRADAWIVLESAVTHGAQIVGTGGDPPAIGIEGNFIEVHGFQVTNPSTEPCIGGQGSDVRIVQNYVHDCGGGGIAMHRGGRYYIEGNVVARTSFVNRWQMSGISMFQARGHARCPSGFCNVVRRNITYGNDNHVLNWQEEGPTDGNGIIIDDFANTQLQSRSGAFAGWTLVEQNLTFGNGGSGVRVYFSDRVIVRNNTSYRNMLRRDGASWRGELMNAFGSQNRLENNIAIADTAAEARNVALFDSGRRVMLGRRSQAEWRNNVVSSFPNLNGTRMRVIEGGAVGTPFLVDEEPVLAAPGLDASADFRLLGLRGADGVLRAPGTLPGANPELLPPLR